MFQTLTIEVVFINTETSSGTEVRMQPHLRILVRALKKPVRRTFIHSVMLLIVLEIAPAMHAIWTLYTVILGVKP